MARKKYSESQINEFYGHLLDGMSSAKAAELTGINRNSANRMSQEWRKKRREKGLPVPETTRGGQTHGNKETQMSEVPPETTETKASPASATELLRSVNDNLEHLIAVFADFHAEQRLANTALCETLKTLGLALESIVLTQTTMVGLQADAVGLDKESEADIPKTSLKRRGPGRPKGSKNRTKPEPKSDADVGYTNEPLPTPRESTLTHKPFSHGLYEDGYDDEDDDDDGADNMDEAKAELFTSLYECEVSNWDVYQISDELNLSLADIQKVRNSLEYQEFIEAQA